MKNSIAVLSLFVSLALLVGCASELVSTDSGSSPTTESTADNSFNETQARISEQMALDAANAAAAQQFNDAMAAAQQTMNQHNDDFNQNGLH
jgi:hypothetical protein